MELDNLNKILSKIKRHRSFCYEKVIPEKKEQYRNISDPHINLFLRKKGIRLYSHQSEGILNILEGRHVCIATPTASGKTLCYHLPIIKALINDKNSKALLVYPLKALAQDQKVKLQENLEFMSPFFRCDIYDGDTRQGRREKIKRDMPSCLITNPDMLHYGLLAHHHLWEGLFAGLKYIVFDEVHTYRGIFGANVSWVIRRLKRIASFYGSKPQFIATSATVGNPEEFLSQLFDEDFYVVKERGDYSSERHFVILNPEEEESAYILATKIFAHAISLGLRTIVFTKARKITELIYNQFARSSKTYARRVSSYRAGYLPEERREIEQKLFTGELLGVISTSALELGIDIGNLDVCILVGYPGSIINTMQRSGRVGRGRRPSLTVLIAQRDALDQFFVKNPDKFFEKGVENIIVDPANSFVASNHLICAAHELPLRKEELPEYDDMLKNLVNRAKLISSKDERLFFPVDKNPHRKVNIREAGESYNIVEAKSKKIIGTISGRRVFNEVHEGAVYLHKGVNYFVEKLNLSKKEVLVSESFENFYTLPLTGKETEIISIDREIEEDNYIIAFGRLKVTERVIGYERKDLFNQNLLSREELDMPPYTFETQGLVLKLTETIKEELENGGYHLMGSLHATEHALIGLMPTIVLCDRQDIGGICYPYHYQVDGSAIFIYDGYDGGVGLSLKAFLNFRSLLSDTLKLLEECDCETGCPSCIHSPKCGSQNYPLDKEGALFLIKNLIHPHKTIGRKSPFTVKKSESKSPQPFIDRNKKAIFFDLETQRLADEVGGWQNAHLLGLAVAVVYDEEKKEFELYEEKDVLKLIERLESAEMVVGFNTEEFDFKVLMPYAGRRLNIRSFDLLKKIKEKTGKRKSLSSLARINLGDDKSGDGVLAVKWFREGQLNRVIEYCMKDVEILHSLYSLIRDKGYLLMELNGMELRVRFD